MPQEAHSPPKRTRIAESEIRRSGPVVRPRDAATLIIVRRDGRHPRVLMGRRASSHAFMPNKFVFPGGRVDPGDSRIRPPRDLHPVVKEPTLKPTQIHDTGYTYELLHLNLHRYTTRDTRMSSYT